MVSVNGTANGHVAINGNGNSSSNGHDTMPSDAKQITVSEYIVERIKQVGVKQVFGVPGDYNLEFLDYIENDDTLKWVGNANELNAAYAADGYARVKHNLGVLVTTFGVGELSALNGVAGSMAERLPILHIVGTPSTKLQGAQAILHHTLGNGSFTAFQNMSAEISAGMAILKTGGRWTDEIDRVLSICLTECKPVYLALPTDFIHAKVYAEDLNHPLPHPHSAPPNPTDLISTSKDQTEVLNHVVDEISHMFEIAQNPIVLVDCCTERFGCGPEIRKLVEATGVRFFETPMGKSTVDEQHPQFGGIYVGSISLPAVRAEVESADFVLVTGKLESDFNSGGFTFKFPTQKTVELHSFATKIGYATYPGLDMRTVLPILTKSFAKIAKTNGGYKTPDVRKVERTNKDRGAASAVPEEASHGKEITQAWLWPRTGKFFRNKDVIIAETGTSSFGIINIPFPSKATFITQALWGSIGYAAGSTLGAALAAAESDEHGRVILFTGDGALQMTVQEIGTMLRHNLTPYIFVLNNDGYEVERLIHGEDKEYNNIQMYDWQLLLPFFAGKSKKSNYESFEVHTPEELDQLLLNEDFLRPGKLRLIEMYMPRGDVPDMLQKQAKLTREANAKV